MSARDIYENGIRQLPAMDRLRLASLILDDLAASDGDGLDIRDDWSDEDIVDLTKFSLNSSAALTKDRDA
jgi:hypothetical protein